MAVLQKFVSLNQQTVMEMHSNKLESTRIVRKVRIICSDPYATDPSDDEGISSKNGKRFIREICLPFTSYRVSNASVTEGSAQDRNNGGKNPQRNKVLNLRGKKSSLSSRKYRGVRQRKWGKWSAEIRHPVNLKRIWLGTYKSAEDASIAYETKRIEFEALFAQDQNLTYDSASSSGLALDSSTLALVNGNDYEVTRKANVVEKEFTESERVDEELIALAQIGKELDLDLELDSIMLEGDDFTIDDFVKDFEDIPICGLFNEDQPGALPDFDFNFDFEDYSEAFSRMEEAPALMNGASPLNIACP